MVFFWSRFKNMVKCGSLEWFEGMRKKKVGYLNTPNKLVKGRIVAKTKEIWATYDNCNLHISKALKEILTKKKKLKEMDPQFWICKLQSLCLIVFHIWVLTTYKIDTASSSVVSKRNQRLWINSIKIWWKRIFGCAFSLAYHRFRLICKQDWIGQYWTR